MPSRAMIHSGRTLFHLNDNGSSIPEEHSLLGEELQKQGYNCCGIGKWHNSPRSFARSFNSGGEIFFGGMWDHWNVPACNYDPEGKYDYAVPYISDAFHSRELTEVVSDHISPGKHSSTLFSDFATDWLKNYKDEKPFFLYTAFMAPHDPRTMPEEFLRMYDPEKLEIPPNFQGEHLFDYGVRDVRDEVLAPYPRTEAEVRQHLAEYYGMISHLDYEIGRILETLKEKGEYENTIIVLAGDNGLALGQHGLFGKQSAYEHSVRVPLIFCGPGIHSHVTDDRPCYLLDIGPTLLDLLDLPAQEGAEGISLKAPLTGSGENKVRETLYFVYADLLRAVKKDGFKLVEYASEYGRHTQLFCLKEDPYETTDLSRHPSYAPKIEELRESLLEQRDLWDDNSEEVSRKFWEFYSA